MIFVTNVTFFRRKRSFDKAVCSLKRVIHPDRLLFNNKLWNEYIKNNRLCDFRIVRIHCFCCCPGSRDICGPGRFGKSDKYEWIQQYR